MNYLQKCRKSKILKTELKQYNHQTSHTVEVKSMTSYLLYANEGLAMGRKYTQKMSLIDMIMFVNFIHIFYNRVTDTQFY